MINNHNNNSKDSPQRKNESNGLDNSSRA